MQPTRDIEHYLAHLPIELQDIVLELRNIIATIAPTATETRHRKGFSYYYAEHGGPVSAGICQILIIRDHIELAFIHGAFLPDPKKLLEGKSHYKKFVRISSYDEAPWDDLKKLIAASFHFDLRSQSFE